MIVDIPGTRSGVLSLCLLLAASVPASQGLSQNAEPNLKSAMRNPPDPPLLPRSAQLQEDDFSVADVSGPAGQQIPLNIATSPNAAPDDLFTITGMPPEVKLTAGEPYNDFWLLRRKDLHTLAIVTPEGFTSKITIAVTRARSANRAPLSRNMSIEILSAHEEAPAAVVQPAPKPKSAYIRTPNESALFDKAYEQFKQGDISGARAIFEYFAMKGDAQAAVAMGETYDPVVLRQLYVKGLAPDAASAAAWYKKAQQLGDSKARTRLDALNQ